MQKIKNKINNLLRRVQSRGRLSKLEEFFSAGLPKEFRPALQYLITRKADEMASLVASEAEARRAEIASEGDKQIPIWYSPKPGSAGKEVTDAMRPSPGKVLDFTMTRVANTGKNEAWGTVLYLLAREFRCRCGVELGTCAGISAMYLSSIPTLEKLITVEGSAELSKIAKTSLKGRLQVDVINSLFDDAIDGEIASLRDGIDFAFIDGHHEKLATIHYFNRLLPYLKKGSLVLFDDISWSQDMREAWNELSNRVQFSHSIDLGAIGVCLIEVDGDQHTAPPKKWDLQPLIGLHPIGDPHGWKE